MAVTKFILAVLIALTSWDVVTTYYGAVSVFVGFNTDVGANLGASTAGPILIHQVLEGTGSEL
jgi:hypothetical protein